MNEVSESTIEGGEDHSWQAQTCIQRAGQEGIARKERVWNAPG